MLLKDHDYLVTYDQMNEKQQGTIVSNAKILYPLTGREKEGLQLILSGKSNRIICDELAINESTVKTHARNIYSKYNVGSRVELTTSACFNHNISCGSKKTFCKKNINLSH